MYLFLSDIGSSPEFLEDESQVRPRVDDEVHAGLAELPARETDRPTQLTKSGEAASVA